MPYPDAKYPPAKAASDRMRLALVAIRDDCRDWLAVNTMSQRHVASLITGVWDCSRTALGERDK